MKRIKKTLLVRLPVGMTATITHARPEPSASLEMTGYARPDAFHLAVAAGKDASGALPVVVVGTEGPVVVDTIHNKAVGIVRWSDPQGRLSLLFTATATYPSGQVVTATHFLTVYSER